MFLHHGDSQIKGWTIFAADLFDLEPVGEQVAVESADKIAELPWEL